MNCFNKIKKIKRNIVFLLKWFYLIKPKYKFSYDINFGSKKANIFFKKEIGKSRFYFEYGSGSSTIYAQKNKISFASVESCALFYNFLKTKIKKNYFLISFGPCKDYSHPIFDKIFPNYYSKIYLNYARQILKFKQKKIDLVLIDGRCRVLCAMIIHKFLKNKKNIKVLVDDFFTRKNYLILENYYKIKKIGRMALLRPKKNTIIKNKFIIKYSYDCA